jgi:excisionase family DNA binding protein
MELTTKEAADRLGVSQRWVERLIAAGSLTPTRRVGRTFLLDAAQVVSLAARDRRRGRPWSQAVAWAALWELSGLEATWIDGQTAYRLGNRLHGTTAPALVWSTRSRAQVRRYRASPSFRDGIGRRVRLTGANGLSQARDMMDPPSDRIDGYCAGIEEDGLVRDFLMVQDPAGNVTLRVTDCAAVAAWQGTMPSAAVGADLAESLDWREAAAGHQLLESLLP